VVPLEDIFREHAASFANYGGDTENLAFQCKLVYAQRHWCDPVATSIVNILHLLRATGDRDGVGSASADGPIATMATTATGGGGTGPGSAPAPVPNAADMELPAPAAPHTKVITHDMVLAALHHMQNQVSSAHASDGQMSEDAGRMYS
jgi:hypothetical protein